MSGVEKRKIFCLGLSRTGTTALAEKLDSLGYRTLHYSLNAFVRINEIAQTPYEVESPRSGRYWSWAFKRELRSQDKFSFDEILDQYDAFADLPFPLLYRELAERYPDACFILTSRDEKSWLKSMKWLLNDGHVLWDHGLLDDSLLTAAYGNSKYVEETLLPACQTHQREVREYFGRSNRFVELRLDQGDFTSSKLVDFLGLQNVRNKEIEKSNVARETDDAMRRRHTLTRSNAFFHFISILVAKMSARNSQSN